MVKTWTERLLRALLIAVVVMSAATTLFFAAAVCLGMIVVLVSLLAVAWAANPSAFRRTAAALRDQLSAWIDQLTQLVSHFMTCVRTGIDTAMNARDAAEPQEKDPSRSDETPAKP